MRAYCVLILRRWSHKPQASAAPMKGIMAIFHKAQPYAWCSVPEESAVTATIPKTRKSLSEQEVPTEAEE